MTHMVDQNAPNSQQMSNPTMSLSHSLPCLQHPLFSLGVPPRNHNRDPVDRMISHFTATFRSDSYEEGCSLAITGGRGGARLTHSHER